MNNAQMNTPIPPLETLRERIDGLDEQIQDLITQRAEIASLVRQAKAQAGQQDDTFFRPEREAQVLRAVKARNSGPLPDDVLVRLFREIMSACLAHQSPLKIAFLGPEGTYSQMAAQQFFGQGILSMPENTIDAVFAEVESGVADFGVVPVENSTEGSVNNTLDMFLSSPLKICGELDMPIHHCLMRKQGGLEDIEVVYSHRQSLAQCRAWLHEHLPNAEKIAVSSNAEAARRAQLTPHAAAIAGETAASMYGLNIIVSNIEDRSDNATRFLIIGKHLLKPSGEDRTSIMAAAKDQPGALFHILKPLADAGVSMTRIESRPSKQGRWDYVFFVDLNGHAEDEPMAKALRELQRITTKLKILGSYPKSV